MTLNVLVRTTVLVVSCSLFACKKQVPLATIPAPTVRAVPKIARQEKLPEPPAPETSAPGPVTESAITTPPVATIPPPPDPPKKARKKRATKPVPVPAPVQTAKIDPPPPAPAAVAELAPKLEQLLSPEQEQSYNQTIDQDLVRARNNLKLAQTKTLSDAQKVVVTQVLSFIKQAEDSRKTDLVVAKGLSHKADILASDLASSLQ